MKKIFGFNKYKTLETHIPPAVVFKNAAKVAKNDSDVLELEMPVNDTTAIVHELENLGCDIMSNEVENNDGNTEIAFINSNDKKMKIFYFPKTKHLHATDGEILIKTIKPILSREHILSLVQKIAKL